MKKANKGKVGLILAFAAALSCSSVVAITKLCADGGSVSIASAETAVELTEKSYTADELASLWSSAVQESKDTGEQVTFTLPCNWTAQPDEQYTTSFGSGTGFLGGRISVPGGANVLLDLNGYTIDRGLSSSGAVANGSVIVCTHGILEIDDGSESGAGLITGGNSTGNGGAIFANMKSEVTLTGGAISGNKVKGSGAGVYLAASTLTINGGKISDNDMYPDEEGGGGDGGGVYANSSSSVTMNGGEISNNMPYNNGGGVWIGGDFTMNGGKITGNRTDNVCDGGGVYVNGGGVFTMNDGEISGSTWVANGGGVYVNDAGAFEMYGGKIIDNEYFGVYAYAHATFDLYGGEISGNEGGVYLDTNADSMRFGGGIINNNVVEVYNDAVGGFVNEKRNLQTTKPIVIEGVLSRDTYIGIDADSLHGVVTQGYVASGNKLSNAALHFASDQDNYVVSNNGTEITLESVSEPVVKETVDWSYKSFDSSFGLLEEVTVEEGTSSATATYTGGSFTFNAISEGIATAVDSNGKIVSNFSAVGKYYLNVKAQNAGNYVNPIFSFEILPADIANQQVEIKTDPATYTGSELTTSVKVLLNGALLEEGKDYTVSYENNVTVGNGKVIITAKGNYTGTVSGEFEIQKAKLGVRWGLTTLTYNGGAQALEVYPEGLKGDDEVTLTVKYFDSEGNECTPEAVGRYVAKVSLEDDNYELSNSSYETYFTIVSKKVDAVWSETSFIYDGNAHEITAYFTDSEGNEVPLVITVGDVTNAGTYEATAALPATGYENYELTASTATVSYKIEQAEVEAVWQDSYDFKYDETVKKVTVTLAGLNGEDLSAAVTYKYYNSDGAEVAEAIDAGTYTVEISYTNANYKLVGKTKDTFTIAKADLAVTLNDGYDSEYSGEGKTPLESVKDEYGNELSYTVKYAPADADGNPVGEFVEKLPVNVGKYVLKVEVDASNVAQSEYTAAFEITAMTVTVEWDFGDTATLVNGVYTYLYNGKTHQPTATAQGVEELTLTVTGMGKGVGDGYKTVASLNNNNYVLDGDKEVTFNIIKSKVSTVLWYEYGATEPVAPDAHLSYEYVFVHGQEEGAKLSAFGVLVPADETVAWNNDENSLIALNVTYERYSEGYWTELGTYKASASLASADKANDACYMPLGINDEIEFEVTGITHSASVANIKWIVIVNGKHVPAAGYNFVYNGSAQTPVAIRILSTAYDPDDPDEETFEVLKVGGAMTEAGTNYAYVIPEGNYEIKDEDSECEFVISPLEIAIEWEDTTDDGKVEVTYNGKEQAPKAYYLDSENQKVYLEVEGYTDAGEYFAIAEANDNLEITNDNFVKFVIKQFEISSSDIVWDFADGDVGEKRTDTDGTEYFVWKYDGKNHFPTASLKVVLEENGEEIEIKLALTGVATTAGTHYAYATLDSTDYANANFVLPVTRLKLEIVQDTVTAVWEDENEDGELIYTYDGTEHSPKAYYLNDAGEKVYLTVVASGTEAGNYVALITDDIDISNGKTKIFTVKEKTVKVTWDRTEYDYNGNLRTPSVTFYDTVLGEDGSEVEIELVAGVDFTVTGYTNAGNYKASVTLLNNNYKIDGDASHDFVINKKQITLVWTDDEGNVPESFEWKYDGNSHAPTATTGVDGLEVTVKGAEKNVGTYKAVAVLDNDNYEILNPEQEYVVAGSAISIIWEYGDDALTGVDEDGNEYYYWEYDGKEHSPKAFIKLEDGTKGGEIAVVGAGIYAGEYTAKAILPSNCDWAEDESGELAFTVAKKTVYGIIWTGVDGSEDKFDWEYDGKPHAPKAQIRSTGEVLTVLGAKVNVNGEGVIYTATAKLANEENYVFADDVEYTIEFSIHAKEVSVDWDFGTATEVEGIPTYAYDGQMHSPTASFTFDGVKTDIPVIGGTASGGEHNAKLVDVFANFDFSEASKSRRFNIAEMGVTVEWDEGDGYELGADGEITYTYEYTGKAQMPELTAADADGNPVKLNYLIKNGEEAVSAIINAGTYTVTVSSSDKNYKITNGKTTVTVIVKPMEVAVEWDVDADGNAILTANGTKQAPKAWFVDANGQTIELKVEGAQTEVGEGYEATVSYESDNYVLTGDKSISFKIVPGTETEYKWDWNANDGLGGWVEVKDETEEGGGNGGETTEPTTPDPTEPTDPKDPDEGDGSEGGKPTDPENPGETEGGDGTLTDPENPNPNPDNGDNEAIVPGQGAGGEDETEEGDGNGDGGDTPNPDEVNA